MSMESHLDKIKNKQSQNREHIMRGVNDDKGMTFSEFFSRDKFDNEKSETTEELAAKPEMSPYQHDALHALTQAKLDSIGVKHIRVTSLENEMMVNAMIMVSEKMAKKFSGGSLSFVRNMLVESIRDEFDDANENPDKYEDYAATLFKIYTQTAALSKKILTNEGDSFKNHIDATQDAFNDPENDIYAPGESVMVRAGFESDPELNKEYEKDVNQLNKSIENLQMIKALMDIDN